MPYRKQDRWVGRVQKGLKIRQKVFDTKRQALEWEAQERKADWTERKETTPTVTALQWANEYLDHAKIQFVTKTYKEKRSVFSRLLAVIDPQINLLNGFHTASSVRFLSDRAQESSGYSANRDRKNLASAWEWGKRIMGLPQHNPFRAVDRFPEERSPRRIPSEEHFWAVYGVANKQDREMLLTMLHTAARKREILSLKWSDVDLKEGRIRLWTRKRHGGTLEPEWLPMTTQLKEIMSLRFTQAQSIYVFTRPDNNLPYKNRQHLLKILCRRAGVPAFDWHSIRHLSASILDQEGMELSVIQAILRHKSATTTARYLHSLRGTRVALDGVFSSIKNSAAPETASKTASGAKSR